MNYPLASSPSMQVAPVRSIPVRRIALPTEHGGWGFMGEPLVAGLTIAFSVTAPWIAMMVIGAFLLRQPLRILVADRFGRQDDRLAATAFSFILLYGGCFAVGLAGIVLTTATTTLLPFLIVLPLIALQIYFDIFRRSRALIPEIAGAIAISSSVAVMALAAGFPMPAAVALWLVFVARLIPSILYVRERLRLEKGKPHSLAVPVAAHASALLLVVILAVYGLVPVIACGAMMILFYRAAIGLSARRTKMRAMQIGVWEVIYGTTTVLLLVIGYYTGL